MHFLKIFAALAMMSVSEKSLDWVSALPHLSEMQEANLFHFYELQVLEFLPEVYPSVWWNLHVVNPHLVVPDAVGKGGEM